MTMMITHYGLNWSERDVFWGRPKQPGQLLGRERTLKRQGAPTKEERQKSKDYRNFIGVYCLYGGGDLIYIGEAGLNSKSTLFSRLRQHRSGALAGRWDTFSWFGRPNCDGETSNKKALALVEAISIAIINPGFNKQAGSFCGAKQVFQVPHERAEGDMETKLTRLFDYFSTRMDDLAKIIEKNK
jgi:hypothetical protein